MSKNNQELKEEWNKRLEEEGFKDIERSDYFFAIKDRASKVYKTDCSDVIEAKLEYYLKLSEYMQTKAPEFDDGIDYFVMHKFSIGYRGAEIVRMLAELGVSRHRKTIMYIRRKYESRWGVRAWKSEQLRSKIVKKKTLR